MASGESWTERPLAALDTETTGTDPTTARCVEVAIVVLDPEGQPTIEGYHTLVNPGVEVPAEAAAVHGITTERVVAEGIPPGTAVREVLDHLEHLKRAGSPVVIYNARYDWPLLRAEAAREGLELPDLPLIDPMVLDRTLDRFRRGKRTLDLVAGHYGVARGNGHAATDDALCAAGVARAIASAFPEITDHTPEELHELQIDWFAEWRDDFNDWLRGRGADWQVTGDWPA